MENCQSEFNSCRKYYYPKGNKIPLEITENHTGNSKYPVGKQFIHREFLFFMGFKGFKNNNVEMHY